MSKLPRQPYTRVLYVNTLDKPPLATYEVLLQAGFEVREVNSTALALETLEVEPASMEDVVPDLVVLETGPESNENEDSCLMLKTHPVLSHVPLLLVASSASKPQHRVKAIEQGADSFMTQPLDPAELVAMVNALMRIKATEAQLRESKAYLDKLFENASGPIIVWNEQGIVTRINLAAENAVGIAAKDIIGKPLLDVFMRPELGQSFLQAVHDQAQKHQVPFEHDHVQSDGGKRTVLWNTSNVRIDSAANALITIAQGLDITERKRGEAQLRIAAIAFECQEGLSVTDAEGTFLQVNQAFCQTTGFSSSEVLGKNPRILSAQRHGVAFYRMMWEDLKAHGVWQGEVINRRKNGEVYIEWLTIKAVKSPTGEVTNYVGTHTDISQRKAAEREIQSLAFYDPLTGLPNRRLLRDRLERAQTVSTRSGNEGAVLFIDLDNFKNLNDTHGHDCGDLLLKQVATRLTTCVREGDTVARQGGDEFVIILENLDSQRFVAAAQAEEIGMKILFKLNGGFILDGVDHHNTVSIGATLFSNHHESIEQLLKQADLAMYQVKQMGRGSIRFFDPSMQVAVDAHSALERELRTALQVGQFLLYYQIQVDTEGHLTGVEALLRWLHPVRGLVLPTEFIALAEETGLILPLGHWVLKAACTQLAIWAGLPALAHLTMAVNVSVREIEQNDFVAQVVEVILQTGIDPQKLKLELTESVLMRHVDEVIKKMNALRVIGVRFALDDFGTGYSSLSALRRLPIDRLKIDQSFVQHILSDESDAAIAKTIVAMAHSLNLNVIAEGVETQGQRDFLVNAGCHNFQGFLYGMPQKVEFIG